jgi:hypothetical protein
MEDINRMTAVDTALRMALHAMLADVTFPERWKSRPWVEACLAVPRRREEESGCPVALLKSLAVVGLLSVAVLPTGSAENALSVTGPSVKSR